MSDDDDEDDVTVVPMFWPVVTNIDDLPSTQALAEKLAVLGHVDEEETPTSQFQTDLKSENVAFRLQRHAN